MPDLPKELLSVIVCPSDKNDLEYSKDKNFLVCVKCKKKYEIKDGIPVLTIE